MVNEGSSGWFREVEHLLLAARDTAERVWKEHLAAEEAKKRRSRARRLIFWEE